MRQNVLKDFVMVYCKLSSIVLKSTFILICWIEKLKNYVSRDVNMINIEKKSRKDIVKTMSYKYKIKYK